VRQEPDHFGDNELSLVYIAKRLNDALALEDELTKAGIDYLVEPDQYTGGIIFRTERTGAFFYVDQAEAAAVREKMTRAGFKPWVEETD
jgi:hypothetical protein